MKRIAVWLAFLLVWGGISLGCGVTVEEISGNPTCDTVCSGCYSELKVDPPKEGHSTDGTLIVNIFNVVKKLENGKEEWVRFDWSSNIPVNVVLVKGGPSANAYTYDPPATSGSGLKAPKCKGISHIIFCYCPPIQWVVVSGLSDLEITQLFIGQGNRYGSLGTLRVVIVSCVNYTASVCYTYTVVSGSTSPFTGDPLSLQANSGTWYTIPEYPSSTALPDFSGHPGIEIHFYPVRVDLSLLGDRDAGDVIQFTVHVTVSASSP